MNTPEPLPDDVENVVDIVDELLVPPTDPSNVQTDVAGSNLHTN